MRQQVAKVIYDSARTPEVAGVRGGTFERRSIGFLAESIRVEMMLEDDAGDFYHCAGQVLDRAGREPCAGVRVSLGIRGEATATTDDYGEFMLAGQLTGETQVFILHGDAADVVCCVPSSY